VFELPKLLPFLMTLGLGVENPLKESAWQYAICCNHVGFGIHVQDYSLTGQ
jgi:hypothetical protein